jgi:hypothetical protein
MVKAIARGQYVLVQSPTMRVRGLRRLRHGLWRLSWVIRRCFSSKTMFAQSKSKWRQQLNITLLPDCMQQAGWSLGAGPHDTARLRRKAHQQQPSILFMYRSSSGRIRLGFWWRIVSRGHYCKASMAGMHHCIVQLVSGCENKYMDTQPRHADSAQSSNPMVHSCSARGEYGVRSASNVDM